MKCNGNKNFKNEIGQKWKHKLTKEKRKTSKRNRHLKKLEADWN